MNQEDKIIKFSSYCLCFVGTVCAVDTFLFQIFNLGSYSRELSLGYCIGFIIASTKYPEIIKKKYVVIPLYLMIVQLFYSLIITYL